MNIMTIAGKMDFSSHPLPAPKGDVPFHAPIRHVSQPSFRRISLSPAPSSSSPSFATRRASTEEGPSAMDPQIMTHFVTQIHKLEEEMKKKDTSMLHLEEQLYETKEENANLRLIVEKNARETRNQSRQMDDIQGSAEVRFDELTQERDNALSILAETRKRVDSAQSKMKKQEREIADLQKVYESDRLAWENERRRLLHKVTLADNRLTVLANELATKEADMPQLSGPMHHRKRSMDAADLEAIDEDKVGTFERSESRASNASSRDGRKSRNTRGSMMSNLNGNMSQRMGVSLADELPDEYEEEDIYDDEDGDDSRASPSHPRPFSAQSHIQSSKARRLLGLMVESEDVAPEEAQAPEANASRDSEQEKPLPVLPTYTNSSTQFSPPNSPDISFSSAYTGEKDIWGHNELKRFSSDPSTPLSLLESHLLKRAAMVSTASQTLEQPISPPDTPVTKEKSMFASEFPVERAEMITSATQTIDDSLPGSSAGTRPHDKALGLAVPVIAIDRADVGSSPDRTSVMLPPQTKNVGVQVSMKPLPLRSVSVQTEEIRIDQRLIKLPPHLLPSSISSTPPSPIGVRPPTPEPPQRPAPLPLGPRYQKRGRMPPPTTRLDVRRQAFLPELVKPQYPNDNGPLADNLDNQPNRPVRKGSLFAGFDDSDVEEEDGAILTKEEWTDEELAKTWKPPARKTVQKVDGKWTIVPKTKDALSDRLESNKLAREEASDENQRRWDEFDSSEPNSPVERPKQAAVLVSQPKYGKTTQVLIPKVSNSNLVLQGNISKPSLVTQASLSQVNSASKGDLPRPQRTRSPSEPAPSVGDSIASAPPFPVPTRLSSRKAVSASDRVRSPTPLTTSFFSNKRAQERSASPTKKPALRKVRSAVTISKHVKRAQIYGDEYPYSPTSSLSLDEHSPPPIPDVPSPPLPKEIPPPIRTGRLQNPPPPYRYNTSRDRINGVAASGGIRRPAHDTNTYNLPVASSHQTRNKASRTDGSNTRSTSYQDEIQPLAPQDNAYGVTKAAHQEIQHEAYRAGGYDARSVAYHDDIQPVLNSNAYGSATISYHDAHQKASRAKGFDTRSTFQDDEIRPVASQADEVQPVVDKGVSTPEIVDAVAFAMVGEWMWKYTRKRTSFSLAESRSREAESLKKNGPRHQRWVWILPAEKEIMWSAKRPASETLMLGKNARRGKF